MKDLERFAQLAESQGATIAIRAARSSVESFLQPDALLQTPLIAFCLLLAARGSSRGLETGHTATLTSAVFTAYFVGLGDARGRLTWSPAMRIKCAEALAELEGMNLVEVAGAPRRFVLTAQGKEVVRTALAEPQSEIGKLAHGLVRAHEEVKAMGWTLL